jgi:hypothetical protein
MPYSHGIIEEIGEDGLTNQERAEKSREQEVLNYWPEQIGYALKRLQSSKSFHEEIWNLDYDLRLCFFPATDVAFYIGISTHVTRGGCIWIEVRHHFSMATEALTELKHPLFVEVQQGLVHQFHRFPYKKLTVERLLPSFENSKLWRSSNEAL